MSKLEKGEIALFKYNKLRFSFANLNAGDQQILTSDPWSLINSHLQQKISKSRGENKVFLERALFFLLLQSPFTKQLIVSYCLQEPLFYTMECST
ncbi:hypothetical protein VXO80_04115 [Acinetobacter towneri]|uniref:hypothetical protein n=1 Tax=Acinetobacter towneri TaxID=202956 RepID=UPI003A87858A